MKEDDAKQVVQEWLLDRTGEGLPVLYANDFDQEWYVFQFNERDPSLSLLARMGMPIDILPLAAAIIPGRKYSGEFKDFRVELFGLRGAIRDGNISQHPDLSKTESEFLAGAYGVFEFPISEKPHVMSLHIWRVRLFMKGSEMYLEQLWHTQLGKWLRNIFNLNCDHGEGVEQDAQNLKKIAKGMPLLHLTLNSVKPQPDLDKFTEEAYQAIDRLARNQARRAKRGKQRVWRGLYVEPLAAEIGCGKQTVYKYKNVPGLWQHLDSLYDLIKSEPSLSLPDALNRLKAS